MQLAIETFSNQRGGNSFYKAVTHPAAAPLAVALIERLAAARSLAIYDPLGFAAGFSAIHGLERAAPVAVFVQDIEQVGRTVLGCRAQPVTELAGVTAELLLVAAFDAGRLIDHIRHLVPAGTEIVSFDQMRLPDDRLTNRRNYLDPLNFATNFAFFRDAAGLHTRLATANYWAGYGAREMTLAFALFDGAGEIIAEWRERLVPNGDGGLAGITVDSRDIRRRFGLPEFTGQLFIHAIGAAGHDVVKYALDTFADTSGGERTLSCTHDANSWPADFYAGLPAPAAGERVILWLQNSHPCTIPAGAIALNRMGKDEIRPLDQAIPPFATHPLDVGELMPGLAWPEQLELRAGKYFVRPRYEVIAGRARRIAHVNVERTDLVPDPRLPELGNLMGKGFLLPAPILPVESWRTLALPTPMATRQQSLPIAAIVYDPAGREVGRHRFGALPRSHAACVAVDEIAGAAALPGGFGHLELVYDFAEGHEADGWLHGLFRYEDRGGRHAAETSFGAHVFNTVLTYKSEPQVYIGRPPGLSTRLFLRLGEAPLDTLCHLIYPASTPWHAMSATDLVLCDSGGGEVTRKRVAIPCSGSLFWRYHQMFDAAARRAAGVGAYIIIRDTTCRLFGYHGLVGENGAFSLDHMFGF